MKLESIKELLETICQYNTVSIIQTFMRTDTEWIEVRCQSDTRILELTCIKTKTVKYTASIGEAAAVIEDYNKVTPLLLALIQRSIETNHKKEIGETKGVHVQL